MISEIKALGLRRPRLDYINNLPVSSDLVLPGGHPNLSRIMFPTAGENYERFERVFPTLGIGKSPLNADTKTKNIP
jgi:hypothetical protein